jgi:hypothetical protein
MTDSFLNTRFLPVPKFFGKAPRTVRTYEPEEFSASPVDDVQRAITLADEFKFWPTEQLADMPWGLALAFEKSLISALVSGGISPEDFTVHDYFAKTELVSDLAEGQLPLKISGDFSPSKKLTDIWISSLSVMAKEVGKQIHMGADFEAAQEFSKTLYSSLGTVAQQLRYESPLDTSLTRHQRFTAAYQIQLCDAFLIVPDQAADFLSLLSFELSEAIRAGCTLNGDWGELRVSPTKELYFKLTPPDFVVDPNFVESEEVE